MSQKPTPEHNMTQSDNRGDKNGTGIPLLGSTGPKGITPNLLFWQQSEEKSHTANSAGPQQAQAFHLQLVVRKKKQSLLLALYRPCCSPCCPSAEQWPHFLYSPWFSWVVFFSMWYQRSAPGSNCTLRQLNLAIFRRCGVTLCFPLEQSLPVFHLPPTNLHP